MEAKIVLRILTKNGDYDISTSVTVDLLDDYVSSDYVIKDNAVRCADRLIDIMKAYDKDRTSI